ncbi:unnamed protein product [Rotaria sp. Silwood2]|nr:unnamed protein product [Rotaria sp. Silwood2]CAF3068131.1 unnamed protein product [Rotaria sp. Silwood2]CAF3309946.1 unnamed protein product [Rotaria sp. Silwood2]CAF3370406.1 unnamed protein product [Rotaria sp. Silwood2]CAF4277519.1 unnamed protein product [Rotaria sp. Silwood2]
MKINEIFPKIDWQKSIQGREQMNNKLVLNNLELEHSEIYQHLCLELKAYLNSQNSNETSHRSTTVNNRDDCANVNDVDYIPCIKEFTTKFSYTIGIALTRVEIWVKLYLKQWINRPSASESEENRFEILLRLYEEYQKEALNYYWSENGPTDPMGYSRFILTSLAIIRIMHENLCNNPSFEQLELHSIDIPNLMKLFEILALPDRDDMISARNLYDYFNRFSSKPYPDLLTNIKSANVFGVRYAGQSASMKNSIEKIRVQIEKDKEKTIKKWKKRRQNI